MRSSLQKMFGTNSTQAALGTPATIPLEAVPTLGNGFVQFTQAPKWLKFVPFGTDANNETINYRIWAWSEIGGMLIPSILLQFVGTFGNINGLADESVTETDFFCDTLGDPVANFGAKGIDCQPHSPQNDTPGFYLVDACGCSLFSLEIGLGTGASGNGLIGGLS
jgi:hypothetical protein